MSCLLSGPCFLYQLRHRNPSEECGRHACGTPGEPLAFPDLILFFPPIASADERNGTGNLLVFSNELAKGKGEGFFYEPMLTYIGQIIGTDRWQTTYPSTEKDQSGISSSLTSGTGP